ncbi:unnamed protein product [Rotaria sp. Silwood2]|nr:unnamed protein product [Rotaria sp. Silwood2]
MYPHLLFPTSKKNVTTVEETTDATSSSSFTFESKSYYTPYTPAPPPPIVTPPHISTNGYNMPGFQPHSAAPYTSTSTFIK